MKLFRVINRVYLLLLQESKKHREHLNKYFLDVVGKAERVGIIDVGWKGTVTVSIKDSISQISNKIKFYGFFVGLLSSPSRHNLILKAWLNSINIHFNLGELIQTGGAEFLEFALSSSHGSVLSYERFDGKVIPILKDISGEEIENIAKAKKLQAGVLEYFEHNKFLFEKFPLEGLLSKEWAVPFVRLLTSPSKREAELLGELTHSDSLGKNSKRSKLAPELPLWHRILKTKRYWREFDHSFWKKGFLVRNQF
ncbi:MAG: hypothetical protein N3A69_15475 [Leptospiraceae bacterium]|nr:hypothetical protein [Leptospiraceae bacterium]